MSSLFLPSLNPVVYQPSGHSLNRGLVGWWLAIPGYNGWGSNQWLDISGNMLHGTLTNMDPVSDWVPCRTRSGVGGAIQIGTADTNDRVFTYPVLDAGEKSLAVWFKYAGSGIGGAPRILAVNSGTEIHSVALRLGDYATGAWFQSGVQPTAGKWERLVYTFSSGIEKLYLDGKEIISRAVTGVSFNTMAIGNHESGGSDESAYGDYDDVRVWKRALSPAEVIQDYQLSINNYSGLLQRVSYSSLGGLVKGTPLSGNLFTDLSLMATPGDPFEFDPKALAGVTFKPAWAAQATVVAGISHA